MCLRFQFSGLVQRLSRLLTAAESEHLIPELSEPEGARQQPLATGASGLGENVSRAPQSRADACRYARIPGDPGLGQSTAIRSKAALDTAASHHIKWGACCVKIAGAPAKTSLAEATTTAPNRLFAR